MSVTLPESLRRPWPRRKDFRNPKNYYTAAASEILRRLLRWSCRRLCQDAAASPPSEWRNGVILGPSHIGDVLYNTPSLPALRAGLPNCRWTYVVSGPSAQVLQGNPYLDEVISLEESGSFRERLARGRTILAPHRFDVALAYALGSSWQDLALALRCGIPNRIGYVHRGFSGLVTHPATIRFPQPFAAYFRDLVSQLTGPETAPNPSLKPLVYLRPEHEQAVDRISTKLEIDWNKQPVMVCAVTSRQPTGIWPQEKFLQTVQYARKNEPCTVIYIGAKSDAAQLKLLAERSGPDTFVLAGELDLLPLVALLRRCRVALTTDSGPRHLANAAGIPVVFIRNLHFRQAEAGAYCSTDYDMAPPEMESLDPDEQERAFAKINPEAVGDQLIRLLRGA